MLTLPETIERDFMVFRKRTLDAVAHLADTALLRPLLRQDDENNPDLLAMLALLGISAAAILNQDVLRQRLRTIARRLTAEKQAEFIRLLGRHVPLPGGAISETWITQQAEAITKSVEGWLAAATVIVAETPGPIAEVRSVVAATAEKAAARNALAASAAVLSLNASLVQQMAIVEGLTHYKWSTEHDSKVRSNHRHLDGSIQEWATPPAGGGTKPGDTGHPGSGHQCRCKASPIV